MWINDDPEDEKEAIYFQDSYNRNLREYNKANWNL